VQFNEIPREPMLPPILPLSSSAIGDERSARNSRFHRRRGHHVSNFIRSRGAARDLKGRIPDRRETSNRKERVTGLPASTARRKTTGGPQREGGEGGRR
jgi:hypothetical protein